MWNKTGYVQPMTREQILQTFSDGLKNREEVMIVHQLPKMSSYTGMIIGPESIEEFAEFYLDLFNPLFAYTLSEVEETHEAYMLSEQSGYLN